MESCTRRKLFGKANEIEDTGKNILGFEAAWKEI